MASFILAGGMGAVLNYALANYYSAEPSRLESGLEQLLQELFVQPISALKAVIPAVFGFFGGTLLLLTWHFLKTRMVRFLLAYDGWFLHPKRPIIKVKNFVYMHLRQ